jgi:hypothetical protein
MTRAWQGFLNFKVNLIRKNGERVDGIPSSSILDNKVFIDDLTLKMEEGDELTQMEKHILSRR